MFFDQDFFNSIAEFTILQSLSLITRAMIKRKIYTLFVIKMLKLHGYLMGMTMQNGAYLMEKIVQTSSDAVLVT